MTESDIDSLMDEFRKAAISCGAAAAKGQTRAANRNTRRLEEVQRELAIRGQEAALLNLLCDTNQWIQVYAAIALLESAETDAIEKLRQIAVEGEPLPSLEAGMAILAWENGVYEYQSHPRELAEEGIHEKTVPALTQELDLPLAIEKVKQLLAKVKKIPRRVRCKDIQQFETMEDRFFAVDRTIGAILGMNKDSVDFCPNNEPPTRDEVLAWLWVIHPEYRAAILELGSDRVREAVLESETD